MPSVVRSAARRANSYAMLAFATLMMHGTPKRRHTGVGPIDHSCRDVVAPPGAPAGLEADGARLPHTRSDTKFPA
jgi:hypothetical protein